MSKQKVAKKTSRAQVIDTALLKYSGKDKVDFNVIASAVIAAKAAIEGERKKVIAQARTRSWWYRSGKKKNPAITK